MIDTDNSTSERENNNLEHADSGAIVTWCCCCHCCCCCCEKMIDAGFISGCHVALRNYCMDGPLLFLLRQQPTCKVSFIEQEYYAEVVRGGAYTASNHWFASNSTLSMRNAERQFFVFASFVFASAMIHTYFQLEYRCDIPIILKLLLYQTKVQHVPAVDQKPGLWW